MSRQDLWYLRSESGEIIGPFPGPMVVRHQLLGRVKPTDEASLDKFEWKSVAAFPELHPATAPEPIANEDPFWSAERAKAKLRWEDERQIADRRNGATPTPGQLKARSGKDRRLSASNMLAQRDPLKLHGDGGRNWIAIAVVLIGCAALVGGLIWLGTVTEPVNPLNVRISR
jgi:hypothetical protein